MPYRGIRNPKKALALAIIMNRDTQFEDVAVKEVKENSFIRVDDLGFGIQKEWTVSIKPGDIARFYGDGVGGIIRGLDINGVQCFYNTAKQQLGENAMQISEYEAKKKAEFENNKASLDKKYNNLPKIFQQRIDKFRANNPDFRYKYEDYEIFCCEQAVVIDQSISTQLMEEVKSDNLSLQKTKDIIVERAPFAMKEFCDMPWEKQKQVVPDLEDGHSGNTFGCAIRLALFYISDHHENIVKLSGALAPLVGSREYGCIAKA